MGTDNEYDNIGTKEKFGVYFDHKLIDIIEADDIEEAEHIAYDRIEKIPLKIMYKGKLLFEDSSLSDYAEDNLYGGRFYVDNLR